jgi:hypothetical protein
LRRAAAHRKKFWNGGGRTSRTDRTRHVTSILKISGCGSKVNTVQSYNNFSGLLCDYLLSYT